MTEKRMLILPAELVKKIDDNRGDISQAEFIDFLIESHLKGTPSPAGVVTKEDLEAVKADVAKMLNKESYKYALKDEMAGFQEDTKKLLKSFVDFFIGYGLELGKDGPIDLKEITSKMAGLDKEANKDIPEEGREVKIKWK
ncbi:putative transcriptional regulator [Dehalogenimonas formicexedens]|uniref:Putative transcriptional regulator n=1 Tax=Dehalogenimonas formicexedens TaxID=1839801 RepID=A0A1P8F9R9_9CHLR|nr:hypothetical protein [Dehalogenimonas formicexedens]APV45188.1 putative transcriptional regulator [Dehalogenimonas formicexedens]